MESMCPGFQFIRNQSIVEGYQKSSLKVMMKIYWQSEYLANEEATQFEKTF